MPQQVGRRPRSRLVPLGAALTALAALILVAGPVGYRLGILPLSIALLTMLRWGLYAAIAALGVTSAGLVATWMRPRERRGSVLLALASLLVAGTLVAMPLRFRFGPPAPPIHDISTDMADPPPFVAVLPLRAGAPNIAEYGGDEVAAQQRRAYPDIQPLVLDEPPAQAFDRALATAGEMGWDLVDADPAAGRIEATDTTFWYGFKDDVVIRIRPANGGSRIDVRSVSRVGRGDVGTNAARIRRYLDALRN